MKSFPPVPPPPPARAVSELQRLLGPAVFIAWPKGVKGTRQKWRHLTCDHMTPDYLSKLPDGNIGVALGDVSGGLCAVDIDDDKFVQPILDLNPALADTFQTHGSRGRVFWLRIKGDCPPTRKFKDGLGEFRATGSQSIAWGVHPDTGQRYQWLTWKPAKQVEFASIQWPDSLGVETTNHLGQELRTTSLGPVLKDVSYVTVERVSGSGGCVSVLSDSVKAEIQRAVELGEQSTKQNNSAAFKAVLALLAIRNVKNLKDMPSAEQDYFADAWFAKLTSLNRTHKAKAHYLADIYNSIQNAEQHHNMNTNGVVQKAWALAQTSPLPPEAARFEGDTITQNLIALGWQLHQMNEGRQWPLGRDKAGKVMQLTASQIRRDLDDSFKVVTGRIFKVARPWDKAKHLATEYLYVCKEQHE